MFNSNQFILDSKYFKWYLKIVENAKVRSVPICYTERHHILPRCLGGSNNIENIVRLTAREHYICHHLLYHAAKGNAKHKMGGAWYAMCWDTRGTKKDYRFIPSHGYENARLNASKLISISNKGKRKGKLSPHYNWTIYNFYNFETKEVFTGTKYEMNEEFDYICGEEINRLTKNWKHSSKNWICFDGVNIPNRRTYTGEDNNYARLEEYNFYHKDYGNYIGNKYKLQENYPDCNFSHQGLCDLIKSRQKSHRGWRILH